MADELLALEDIPTALLVVREGTIVAASAVVRAWWPDAAGSLVGRPLSELVEPADREALARVMRDADDRWVDPQPGGEPSGADRSLRIDLRLASPERTPVSFSISGPPDRRLVGIEDRSAERRLSAVIDAVADATLLLDPEGRLLWQSESVAARGTEAEARIGTHPIERLHPEDLPGVIESFAELAEDPEGRAVTVVRSWAVENDDVWQLIDLVGAGRVEHPDLRGVVVQVRNLDQGSELTSLADTSGPLLSLAEAAPVGLLLMNQNEHVVFANRVGRALLGFGELDEVTAWRDLIDPAHRGEVDRLVDAGGAGASPVTTTIHCHRADGAGCWVRLQIAPHRGSRGQAVGVIVALEDVTVEVEARQESERLLHMLDVTSDYVTIFRATGEILHTNAAVRQVLDRLALEGGSGQLRDLLAPSMRQRFAESALGVVEQQDSWQGELEIQVGSGRIVPVSAVALVRRDDQGALDWIAMVARDISDLKAAEADLRRAATIDHLTGLANRALFTERLEDAVAQSGRTGRRVAMLFCDLDRFKEVNDQHGHAVGDAVLRTIAERIARITRDEDLAARVGGDEFVILCEGTTDNEALAALAERVIASVTEVITVAVHDREVEVQVGISVGVSVTASGDVDADRALVAADQAMYRAKATGGNRYRVTEVGPA